MGVISIFDINCGGEEMEPKQGNKKEPEETKNESGVERGARVEVETTGGSASAEVAGTGGGTLEENTRIDEKRDSVNPPDLKEQMFKEMEELIKNNPSHNLTTAQIDSLVSKYGYARTSYYRYSKSIRDKLGYSSNRGKKKEPTKQSPKKREVKKEEVKETVEVEIPEDESDEVPVIENGSDKVAEDINRETPPVRRKKNKPEVKEKKSIFSNWLFWAVVIVAMVVSLWLFWNYLRSKRNMEANQARIAEAMAKEREAAIARSQEPQQPKQPESDYEALILRNLNN